MIEELTRTQSVSLVVVVQVYETLANRALRLRTESLSQMVLTVSKHVAGLMRQSNREFVVSVAGFVNPTFERGSDSTSSLFINRIAWTF